MTTSFNPYPASSVCIFKTVSIQKQSQVMVNLSKIDILENFVGWKNSHGSGIKAGHSTAQYKQLQITVNDIIGWGGWGGGLQRVKLELFILSFVDLDMVSVSQQCWQDKNDFSASDCVRRFNFFKFVSNQFPAFCMIDAI